MKHDQDPHSAALQKPGTNSALISVVIRFKIEANQYILNRFGDIHLRDAQTAPSSSCEMIILHNNRRNFKSLYGNIYDRSKE